MADITPYWAPGAAITGHATAALTGGRAVALSAATNGGNPSVGVAGAGLRPFGVAMQDAASGDKVLVRRSGIVDGEAGANIAAGVGVELDSSGRFITLASGIQVGWALDAITSASRGAIALVGLA